MTCISLILLAYKKIGEVARNIIDYISGMNRASIRLGEIIVVSEEIKQPLCMRLEKILRRKLKIQVKIYCPERRLGKGGAVSLGIVKSRCNLLVIMDGDFPIKPGNASSMILKSLISGKNVSCYRGRYNTRLYRRIASSIYKYISMLAFKSRVDVQCGFKVIWRNEGRKTLPFIWRRGYEYDILLLNRLRYPWNIVYVAVPYNGVDPMQSTDLGRPSTFIKEALKIGVSFLREVLR